MQQKQNCGHPLRRKGSISRVSKVTCGLLFCLTTGVFAAGENVELLTSDRIENAVPDQVGKTVTIMVQDEMGPVAGANVVVKGTTNGNISDMDGKVVLQNVPNNSTLVISFIGYTTQEVKVSNQATIHVKLVEDAKALEEVVVIGYGSLDKKQVTSAITSLKADDLMVGVSGADISASLQGKIGGLVMNNLGSANSGTTFQLRGMTSINSGKAPLIVIDGFPGGDIRSLTQDDQVYRCVERCFCRCYLRNTCSRRCDPDYDQERLGYERESETHVQQRVYEKTKLQCSRNVVRP